MNIISIDKCEYIWQSIKIIAFEWFLIQITQSASFLSVLCIQSLYISLLTQNKCLTPIIRINSSCCNYCWLIITDMYFLFSVLINDCRPINLWQTNCKFIWLSFLKSGTTSCPILCFSHQGSHLPLSMSSECLLPGTILTCEQG